MVEQTLLTSQSWALTEAPYKKDDQEFMAKVQKIINNEILELDNAIDTTFDDLERIKKLKYNSVLRELVSVNLHFTNEEALEIARNSLFQRGVDIICDNF